MRISIRAIGLFLLLALPCVWAQTDNIVVAKGGQPTSAALYDTANWMTEADGLSNDSLCPGAVHDRCIYAADEAEAEAILILKEFIGGSGRFMFGEINCGFDGREGSICFIDTVGKPVKRLMPSSEVITPGRPFHILVKGKNGHLEYFIDGKLVGDFDYPLDKPLKIAVNPMRDSIAIQYFRVKGHPVDEQILTFPMPVCRKLIDISADADIPVPAFHFGAGNYDITHQDANKTYKLTFDAQGNARFPRQPLKEIYTNSPGKNVRTAILKVATPKNKITFRVALHDSRVTPKPSVGGITFRNGYGSFVIDGIETGMYSGSLGGFGRQVAGESVTRFGNNGIHGAIVICTPHEFMNAQGHFDTQGFASKYMEQMTMLTARNPHVFFKIFFELHVPPEWVTAHPDEILKLDNGVTRLAVTPGHSLQPSYASALWRQQMGEILRQSIQIFRTCPFADRIPYIRLCYANCGEWNNWGYHESAYTDFSRPMQEAFRNWLKEKYKTDGALQKAWGMSAITLDTPNLVPDRKIRLSGHTYLRGNDHEGQPIVDFYAFFQKETAETIGYFAKIVKEASKREMVVGAYYGYYLGLYDQNPYHFADSGHYGLRYLLDNPDIDFLGGPYPYSRRNEATLINGLSASCRLHNKIWENENDERTHHSGPGHEVYGTTKNIDESIAICKRNSMLNLAAGTTMYYYDFVGDWYRDTQYQETIATMRKVEAAARILNAPKVPTVAILFSEEVIPYFSNNTRGNLLPTVAGTFRNLQSLGIPYDAYLLSDLPLIDFSQYKVVLFPNAFLGTPEIIDSIHKYACGGNRTLLFLHAPGIIDGYNSFATALSKQMTGIGLKVEPEKSFAQLSSTKYGTANYTPFLFKTSIDDPDATITGSWEDGSPAIGEKQHKDWKAVVCCLPFINTYLLRAIMEEHGLRFQTSGRNGFNVFSMTGNFFSMYSRNGGLQTVWLTWKPEIAVDVFTGEIFARNNSAINFTMPNAPSTTVIFAGSIKDYNTFFKSQAQ